MTAAPLALDPRTGLRRLPAWTAAVPLAAVAVASVAIALSAAGTKGYLVPVERRGVRGWIEGPLQGLGLHVSTLGFGLQLAALAVAYLAAISSAHHLAPVALGVGIAAIYAVLSIAPPLLSTDVFNYIGYARLGVVHHLDPYEFVPAAAPRDVLYHFLHWRHTRSAYGPLFTLGTYPLGPAGPAVALWVLKGVAGIAGLGCVALVARIARRLGHSGATAAVAFGLNPVMLIWTVGGAHNDLLMLLALLGGVALLVERREALGGAAIVVALAIKATGGLALPFALVGGRGRGRWRIAAGAAVAALVCAAIAYVAFPDHAAGVIGVLGRERSLVGSESIPHEVTGLFGLHLTTGVQRAWNLLLAGALLAVLVWVRRGGSWIAGLGWGFLALLATTTWIVPWYTAWPLPFAAVTRNRRLLAATLLLQVYIVVNDLAIFAR
ncbi:MAG: alpha,6-mannosyltransferase [Solirubrobacteraceae bacterium]|jgi:alpha-1,6-mannosyltransferase|nr:alpha,6-mannosyltransferase [Solirubrobacteraceae bacterium]